MALAAYAPASIAQSADTGAAESLFQTGKALLEQKNYALACPKLAESYRLDPGTGTLLALALCHEGEGRLATAWGEYAEIVARSRRERRPDREDLAHQHLTALESRLPVLTISVASGAEKIPSLEIKRDGVEVGSGSWATPIPVDPGHHHIEVSAPGYKPFVTIVNVGTDADRQSVVVPVLEHEVMARGSTSSAANEDSRKTLRYAGFAAGGLGIVGLGLGTVFGLRAIGLNNDSKAGCDAQSNCDPASFASRNDARAAGNVSTISFVAGGVLLATGATMVVLSRSRATGIASLRAAPLVTDRGLGLELGGAY
jgi:hypothetical protein